MTILIFGRWRNIPREGEGRDPNIILILGSLSLVSFFLSHQFPFRKAEALQAEMLLASRIMLQGLEAIQACREERLIALDDETDPNRTGLIGLEFSPLTTSRGGLEAKRTTTNPNMAALIAYLLREAGVMKGDKVAVGASASFPALIVAVLSAAEALQVEPLTIISLGSSQWGANDPAFHWLHMQGCLEQSGLLWAAPIGLSLGGEKDTGEGMGDQARSDLESAITSSGIPLVGEPVLSRNVETRMRLYESAAGEDGIRAFVHIGGAWANMGESSEVLDLGPGLSRVRRFPDPSQRGVLYEMAVSDVPIIHLLYIKGLVERYGLTWDPRPLPAPGEGEIYRRARKKDRRFLTVAVGYFLLVALTMLFRQKLEGKPRPQVPASQQLG